jgi:hypothetical protein
MRRCQAGPHYRRPRPRPTRPSRAPSRTHSRRRSRGQAGRRSRTPAPGYSCWPACRRRAGRCHCRPGPHRGEGSNEAPGGRRHREVPADRDLGNPGQAGDLNRHEGIIGGAVAQLSVAVITPGPHAAIGSQRQAEGAPGRDLPDASQVRDGAVQLPVGPDRAGAEAQAASGPSAASPKCWPRRSVRLPSATRLRWPRSC